MITGYFAPSTIGGAAYFAPALPPATGQPAPSGTITIQASDGGQGRRFVLATANATSGSILFDGSGGTSDFGPLDFAIASNAADFTVPGIPAGSYSPELTLTGPGGTAIASGATTFSINGVSGGGGVVVEPPVVLPPVVQSVVVSPATATIVGGNTYQFTAQANGLNNPPQTFNWSSTLGSIVNGLASTPATGYPITITVTAASTLDPNVKGTATLIIAPDPALPPNIFLSTILSAADVNLTTALL